MSEDDRGAAMLPTSVFSTADISAPLGYEAWRSLMAASHDVEADPASFRGCVRSINLGPMLLHEMTASSQAVSRCKKRIKSDGLEHIVLHVNKVSMRGATGDKELFVPADFVTVNALSQPLRRNSVPDVESILVSLSRDLVTDFVPDPEAFHGAALAGSTGALLRGHLQLMSENAHLFQSESTSAIARATALMFAAAARPTYRTIGEARAPIETAAIYRAKRYIKANLHLQDLQPQRIAVAACVSLRTLFRLFAPHGGVASFVRSQRLMAARAELSKSGRPRISHVALRYGFRDAAELSRAYRAMFGYSPSDTVANSASSHKADTSAGLRFKEWVAALG